MKKEYDTSVKEAIERVMSVFSEYIKTTPYFDIVWSARPRADREFPYEYGAFLRRASG